MDMGKPKIRFKGYTDEWEQRKLGEVIEDYVEKTTVENQYPVLTSSQQMGIVLQDDYFSGDRVSQSGNIGYFVIPRGYFAYRSRSDNDVFVFNRNDCIDKGSISYFYPVFKPSGVDSDFLLRRLNYGLETQLKIASEGTGQHVLSLKKFKNMTALFPSINEQRKIGEYFTRLDHLITLHQRKYEQAKTLKKYMLQKMFPQDGMRVPEIRFAGFTDEWEQRKFGELVEKYEDPVETPTEGYMRLGIRSHAKGTFHSYVEKGKELEAAKMFRVAADKFIVNITFGWEHAVAITDENDAGKLVSHRFPQYSFIEGMIPKFFRYLILDENFKHHLELSSPGGAGRNRVLKLSDMLEYKMSYPGSEEQKKIAKFFDNLDHLITLHQRKCDELRKIKKYMLQNMFC